MLPEINTYAEPLTLIAVGLLLAIVGGAAIGRLPIPAPALFLAGSALTARLFPSIQQHVDIVTVERIAVVALIVILLNGGRDIGRRRFIRSLGDITAIGLAGTFLTAAGLTVAARVIFGLPWAVSGVLGAALAPTDPAVMFSVLGRREVSGSSGTVLEGEAGINDPAGIALLLGMVHVATHPGSSILVVPYQFIVQMSIGIAAGLVGGWALIGALRRIPLTSPGLYPVLTLVCATCLYGVTTLFGGSGFSAVFVAGLLLGDEVVPFGREIERFSAGLASFAEVAVFLALGLTVHLASISSSQWLGGLALLMVLAVIVRPLVVVLTLACSALTSRERSFIAWSGLKGAVPILLAAFAVLGGVAHSDEIYNVVFVVVLASVALQGGLVPWVAKRLRIPLRLDPALPWELSLSVAEPPAARTELTVDRGSPADGAELGAFPAGDRAAISVVIRENTVVAPLPDLVLVAGDRVVVLGPHDVEELSRHVRAADEH